MHPVLLILFLLRSTSALPPPTITQDTGEVSINAPRPANYTTTNTTYPITATLFSKGPGPSRCRGRPVLQLAFPVEQAPGPGEGQGMCYDIPAPGGAMCGVFVAPPPLEEEEEKTGCEARVFAEGGCRLYVNTVVFRPVGEEKPVGGSWRSLRVRCGVEVPEEGGQGLEGLLGGVRRRPGKGKGKGKGGEDGEYKGRLD
ncbi:hypothetical protein QBC39DRAFT_362129 [Podospora conica]|nr:hypothetical protein QBC39DRAFT_362129 [Schizothecium conicum]